MVIVFIFRYGLNPKNISKVPTKILSNIIIYSLINIFVKQPVTEISDRNVKVEIIEPIPNEYTSLKFIFSFAVLDANTPVQNIIVSGFETVNKIALINGLKLIICAKVNCENEELRIEVMKIYNPKSINTKEPKYFKIFSILLFLSISLPIPNIAK